MPIPATDRLRVLSDTLLLIVFLAATCLPVADVFFDLDPTRLSEKRRLAPPPPVRLSQPLGVSPTPSVILGRSGWLFFAGDEALASYRAVQPFTEAELAAWQRRIETRRDWLAERGIRFLVVIAPNKETIYPEFMPESLNRVRSVTRLDQLVAHLRAHSSVAIVDPRDALRSAKAGGILYLRTDTHWNDVGAWLLYREIVTGLRRWYPELEPTPATEFAPVTRQGWSGDLATMLGMDGRLSEERLLLEPRRVRLARVADPGPRPEDAQRKLTAAERGEPSLPRAVMFHDSFGVSLQPFLGESFSRIVFSSGPTDWRRNFDAALVERERPALVIQEIAERFAVGPTGLRAAAPATP